MNSINHADSEIEIRIESIKIEIEKLKSRVERKLDRLTSKCINESKNKNSKSGDLLYKIYKIKASFRSVLKNHLGYIKIDPLTVRIGKLNACL